MGSGPQSVAIGDFNGDGKPDIVTANYSASTVSVLLGNANGTFGATTDYGVGNYPISVAVGDVNGDGKLDLVTANYSGNTVSVRLNLAERSVVSGNLSLEGIFASAPAQTVQFTFRSPGFDDFAPSLNIAPAGNFAVNLPKRSGVLRIKGGNYLAASVSVDATGNVAGLTATLGAGDANNDNICDTLDFGVLVNAYGFRAGVAGSDYDPTADFNNDGTVDVLDFGLLVNNYGSAGDP